MAGTTATVDRASLKTLRAEHASAQADATMFIERERAAEAKWKRYFNLTRTDGILGTDATSPVERAEALIGIEDARRDLVHAQLDTAKAHARVTITDAAVRDAKDAEIEARLGVKCAALLKLLHEARPLADEIALDLQGHSRLRAGGLQFVALQSSNERWTSPIDSWTDAVRAAGLI